MTPARRQSRGRCRARRCFPTPRPIAEAVRRIDAAERPVVVAGELIAFDGAEGPLAQFAEASGAAVTTAYRCQDAMSNDHPAYIGHLEINRDDFQERAWEEADLVIAAGARLDGITTRDFSLIRDDQTLIHIYPDAEVLERWPSGLAVRADAGPTHWRRSPPPSRTAVRSAATGARA